MNNYEKIACEVVERLTGLNSLELYSETFFYKTAYEAAKLQAMKFNEDLDNNYIEYLIENEEIPDY